ncbi:MAG: DinB family protein [Betaproteobacteria bacterium]|nr:DinB family protein [Betaproteobacteria bacterium]
MVVIDVLNDAGGRELLFNKYGLRKVPVLAKGDQYAFGQMLEPFAKFVGLPVPGADGLSPEQLYQKYEMVFAAGQRYARQFPTERFRERVIPHRERQIRTLCFHVFRIGEAFLETWNGAEYSVKIADNEPPDSMQTGDDIARYGAGVWKRYETWWSGLEDRTLSRVLKTYYGDTIAHRVFERVTWHSAQHCRQLIAVLERMGIQPDGPLTSADLAGLPLPERLWE